MGPEILPYEVDDDLLRSVAGGGPVRVRVLRPGGPQVVLGRGSRPEVELRLEHCLADGVPLARRRGGGCAVVIDPGNVVIVLAVPAAGLGHSPGWFDRINGWIIDALADMGIAGVRVAGTSDLVLDGRKISGSCIWRSRGRLVYSATLLVRPDMDLVERYLAHPPREPSYRRGRSHRDFMGCIGSVRTAPPGEEIAGRLGELLQLRCGEVVQRSS